MTTLLFLHGWGFGPDIWDGVLSRLNPARYLAADLGFRGRPALPHVERPLVIGHSLGFAWALARVPRPWARAVAVNGFPRFTRSDDFPAGVPSRMVERMVAKFATEPETVIADFLSRCGIGEPDLAGLDRERLGQALAWLGACDERTALASLDCPLLALAGGRDAIVPDAMSRTGFAGRPLEIHPDGGHLLPLSHPEWVARSIAALAATLP